MSNVRQAITQARFNIAHSKLVALEFAVTGLFAGAMTDSIAVGVGVFFVLAVGCALPVVSLVILAGYTGLWTLALIDIGYDVGGLFGSVIIGGVGCLVALGIHLGGMSGLVESAA